MGKGVQFKQMSKVRVRIAPSPTGYAHVGTAYTALFNYGFTRHNKGDFIIRIEDSDLKRNIDGAEDKIYKALDWLGITWDEGTSKGGKYGPYKLSERLDIYRKKANEMVEKGLAYEDDGAIRFKNPGSEVSWEDLIHGKISFPGDQITDFVLLKSDGYPTYNFNVVIDDHMMEITHVIRGEDHISNTPRQIALYKALNYDVPFFGHHPLLLNTKKQKLSKRDAAVDIEAYKNMGILPEAFVNFLSLMGWSHPEDKELFSLSEFEKNFTLERVRKSGAVFNMDKLFWMNSEYIKNLPDEDLAIKIYHFFNEKYAQNMIDKITPHVKARMRTLSEFKTLAAFLFEDIKVDISLLGENYLKHLSSAIESIESIQNWNLENINNCLMSTVKDRGYHTGKFFMDLRISLSGSKVTPPINESIEILGKDKTLQKLRKVLQ